MGIATILASVVYGSNSANDGFSDRVIRDAIMYVGVDLLRTSAVRREEKRLHVETLEELAMSFDDEVEPLVVDIQGTEHRLTGTAEVQYREWRDLLRRMFFSQTGFEPEDMELLREPAPEAQTPAESSPAEEQEAGTADAEGGDTQQVISDADGSAASGA